MDSEVMSNLVHGVIAIVSVIMIMLLVNWLDRNIFSKHKGSNKKDD